MRYFRSLLMLLLLLGWAAPAAGTVEIHFYSKDFASTFPHAFVRLTGTVDATGEAVDASFGFTPVRLTPAVFAGPIPGEIVAAETAYIARSDKHFSLALTDEEYARVLELVERWRNAPQPNYRLNSRNCIHFVADVATALGLRVLPAKGLMKKPKSFLRKVAADNAAVIAQWPSRHAAVVARASAGATPTQ